MSLVALMSQLGTFRHCARRYCCRRSGREHRTLNASYVVVANRVCVSELRYEPSFSFGFGGCNRGSDPDRRVSLRSALFGTIVFCRRPDPKLGARRTGIDNVCTEDRVWGDVPFTSGRSTDAGVTARCAPMTSAEAPRLESRRFVIHSIGDHVDAPSHERTIGV